jgi:hypothetical protein
MGIKPRWLIVGALVGAFIGYMLIPAIARAGIPANEALRPVIGAVAGACIGGLIEFVLGRLDREPPNRPMRRLGDPPEDSSRQ